MTTPEDIITEEGEEISEQNFAQDETDAFDSANVEEAEKPKPEKARGKSKAQAPAPPKEDEPDPSADAKPGDGDADAFPVDVGDRLDRRTRGHHVGRLDLDIGGRELDLLGTLRLGADQADVPYVLANLVAKLAGRLEGDVLHGHAQSGRDLARHVGRDPGGLAVFAATGDQQEVGEIDAGAQDAGGGKLGSDLVVHAGSLWPTGAG